MICEDCNATDEKCFRCNGAGRVCDICGEATNEPGKDICDVCQRELDEGASSLL